MIPCQYETKSYTFLESVYQISIRQKQKQPKDSLLGLRKNIILTHERTLDILLFPTIFKSSILFNVLNIILKIGLKTTDNSYIISQLKMSFKLRYPQMFPSHKNNVKISSNSFILRFLRVSFQYMCPKSFPYQNHSYKPLVTDIYVRYRFLNIRYPSSSQKVIETVFRFKIKTHDSYNF